MNQGYTDYEWFLKNDFKSYAGKWLAIVDRRVVASGNNVAQVIQQTKSKFPNRKPLITKVKDKLSVL